MAGSGEEATASAVPPPLRAPEPLLEREHEVALIDGAVAGALHGEATVLLVEGPAGIGKSRLAAECRRRAAAAGLDVRAARGGELEREFPFGVVRQLFEPALVDPATAALAFAGAGALARPLFDAAGPDDGADVSYALLHGLYWLTVNLASEAPLLLALDDLHWCDRPSLRFLAYLVRRVEGQPIVVVGTLRPSEPGADAALLAELAADPAVVALRPGALSRDAVATIVRARLGDDVDEAFATACHRSTGGNPLLLGELLKSLAAERVEPVAANVRVVAEIGPRAASRALLARLARLAPADVALARAVAVLGDGTELPIAARVAELDEPSAAAAAAALVRAEILRPERPIGFVHPLVQAAVYRDLALGERELAHARAVAVLEELGAPAEQVAAHLLALAPRGDPGVVETLRGAARLALRRGAPESAVALLERAEREPPPVAIRPQVLAELGHAATATHGPAAVPHLRAALDALDDPGERGRTADALARVLLWVGDPHEARRIAVAARGDLPDPSSDLGQRLEALALFACFLGAPYDAEAHDRLHALRTERRGDGPGARMLAALAAWSWTLEAGPAARAAALAGWALDGDVLVEADGGLFGVAAGISLVVCESGDALGVFAAALERGRRRGAIFEFTGPSLWAGYAKALRGELADALVDAVECRDMVALWGVPGDPWPAGLIAEVRVAQGDLAGARDAIARAADAPPGSEPRLTLDRGRLALLLAEARWEEAALHADAIDANAGMRVHGRYLPWRSGKALALGRLGRDAEARALAADDLALAEGHGAPGWHGRALRVLGTLEGEAGLRRLAAAVEVLETSDARLELAEALAALGGRLRRDRRPGDARGPLRRALELAEGCGARPLVEAVRVELAAAGARPRTAALTGAASLTASERRVAELAAGGASNRDIAQALYVTPKTVEVHLSSAYRKLGISSRHALAGALA